MGCAVPRVWGEIYGTVCVCILILWVLSVRYSYNTGVETDGDIKLNILLMIYQITKHDVCMYVCMYVCTYICMYVCMYVCMYICMYICMYVCMYI